MVFLLGSAEVSRLRILCCDTGLLVAATGLDGCPALAIVDVVLLFLWDCRGVAVVDGAEIAGEELTTLAIDISERLPDDLIVS
jgi:hypothetical protein